MNAQQLKNSILQEAIEGRLVPQDPNDEPASVLLDKIRKEKARLVREGMLKKKDVIDIPINKENLSFDIPKSWEWCSLGNIISLLSGRDLTPQEYNNTNDGIPYITGASNFEGDTLIINRWTPKPVAISRYGDLLITCKGTIGTMCFNKIGDIHIARQVMAISPYVVDIKYIKYFLMRIVYELDKKAKSIIPGISREDILNASIPLPPLAEQKRIVARIEELLPKVEEYGKAQEALDKLNEELPERLKKSILQEAIEGRLVPQDPNDEPASVLLDKIRKEKARLVKEGKLKKKDLVETPIAEDEKQYELPNGWEWSRIGQVADFINGLAFKPNEWEDFGIPIIRIQNLTDKDKPFNYTTKSFEEKYLIKNGDLLFSWSATLDSFIWDDTNAWLNQHIFKVVPYKCIDKYYLYYLLKGLVTNLSSITHGLTMKHLTRGVFENYVFALPPLAEQKRIVSKIVQLMQEIDKLKV